MENSGDLYEKASRQLTEYLLALKKRKTPERYEVLRTVCQISDIFSVDQLADEMRQKAKFNVSRSTLFNTLETLVDAKLVIKHNLVRAALYECNVSPRPRTCLVCEHCGSVRRLEKSQVTDFLAGIKARAFSVQQPVLYLHGTCRKCAMALRRSGKSLKNQKSQKSQKEQKKK